MKWLKFLFQDLFRKDSFYLQNAHGGTQDDFRRVRKVSADGIVRFTYVKDHDDINGAMKFLKSGNLFTRSCFHLALGSKKENLKRMRDYDKLRGFQPAERI